MSDNQQRKELNDLITECQDQALNDLPEFRLARQIFRERQAERYEPIIARLQTLLEAHEKVGELRNWFAEQTVALLQANLDSDEISEARGLANRYLKTTKRSLQGFQVAASRLEQAKTMLDFAVAQRRELIAQIEAAKTMLSSLEEQSADKNLLRYLGNRLERLQAQASHGYTPDLDTLKEITEELNRLSSSTKTPIGRENDPLVEATQALLSRYEDQLNLAESRQLDEGLQRALGSNEPTDRWALWAELRELEDKYDKTWAMPKVPSSKRASPRKFPELWELMTDLLTVADESGFGMSLRARVASAFEKSSGKQKKDLAGIKAELERMKL